MKTVEDDCIKGLEYRVLELEIRVKNLTFWVKSLWIPIVISLILIGIRTL